MKRILVAAILGAAFILGGCRMTAANTDGTSDEAAVAGTEVRTDNTTAAAVTEAALTTAAATTAATEATTAATTAEPEITLPLTENTSGKVQIQTVSNSTFILYNSYIITSAEGETIIVDPTEMPAKDLVDLNPAAIVNTQSAHDHNDQDFSDSYDCQKLPYVAGEINTDDFHIYTVASSHMGNTISEKPDNYILVIEVDGLRIAHMGDVGQKTLTEEQLEAIGPIDIAFTQFDNSASMMNLKNMKGFNLIEQLNPKIIIPTHYADADIPVFDERYGGMTEFDNVMTVSAEDLPGDTLNVYHITNTHFYGE